MSYTNPSHVRRASLSLGPTVTSGSETTLSWTTPVYDTAGIWSVAAPTRLTLTAGTWFISGNVSWPPNSTGQRQLQVHRFNSAGVEQTDRRSIVNAISIFGATHDISYQFQANNGDYITIIPFHNAGPDLAPTIQIELIKLG